MLLEEQERRRRRSTETLADFVPRVSPALVRPDHLAPLCQIFERVRRGERVRACVSVPPQHGKTTTVLHAFAWLLKHHPRWTLAYATYQLAQSFSKSREARDIAAAAGLAFHDAMQNLGEWRTPHGGGCLFTSVDGPLTGQGARLVVVDDPYKDVTAARSEAIRDRVRRWVRAVALTRLPQDGSLIVVHTRWYEDDLIGEIHRGLLGEAYDIVNLPFLADEDGTPSRPPYSSASRTLLPRQVTPMGDPIGWTVEGARTRIVELGTEAESIAQGRPRRRAEGALWKLAWIAGHRVIAAPDLVRVVVAIDPSVTAHRTSGETGVVAAGRGRDRRGYVLADRSGRFPDTGWDVAAVRLYDELHADAIVAEVNHGGDLVAKIIRIAAASLHARGERPSPHVNYRELRATRGKQIRAEPIAALYQQGFVSHVGHLHDCEDELTGWDPITSTYSPGRLDALVWALTDLMLTSSSPASTGRVS